MMGVGWTPVTAQETFRYLSSEWVAPGGPGTIRMLEGGASEKYDYHLQLGSLISVWPKRRRTLLTHHV